MPLNAEQLQCALKRNRPMKLVLRTDLGGRAVGLPAAEALAGIPIKKPMVILAGGNGAGKS